MFCCHLGKLEGFTTEFCTRLAGNSVPIDSAGWPGSERHLKWLLCSREKLEHLSRGFSLFKHFPYLKYLRFCKIQVLLSE